MKKYDLVKRTAEFNYKNRKNIEEGCTALDPSPEYIKTFDDLEEAKKELAIEGYKLTAETFRKIDKDVNLSRFDYPSAFHLVCKNVRESVEDVIII